MTSTDPKKVQYSTWASLFKNHHCEEAKQEVVSPKKTAPEIVASIDDLLLQIFRRLIPSEAHENPQFEFASEHLKSLVSHCYPLTRLSLVSRHWNSLISNNFRPKPLPAAGLIFEPRPTSKPKHAHSSSYILLLDQSVFQKIDEPWHRHSKVVHSCNGLLLCVTTTGTASGKRARRAYSVCNPTTGKQSTLPQVPRADRQVLCGTSLAFDPRRSPHYFVVCLLGSMDRLRFCQFVVYSSEAGCWRKPFDTNVGCFGNKNNNNNNNNGVYWNGAIHWVDGSLSQLICFDPNENRLVVMPMPIARNHERYYFGESCGHLHYIGLREGARKLVVHEMSSDYSEGWVVKYNVDVSKALRRTSFGFEVYAVVRVGERAEDMFLVLGTRNYWGGWNKIVRVNHDNTFGTICDFPGFENPDQLNIHPFHFIESLASV